MLIIFLERQVNEDSDKFWEENSYEKGKIITINIHKNKQKD